MLIYFGNSDDIKNKIQKNYGDKNKLVYADDNVSILNNNQWGKQIVEYSKTSVICAEGDILNIKKDAFLSLFESTGKTFLEKIEGYFSLFVWNKHNERAFIVNDKFGLNPLYYTLTTRNELIISTNLGDFFRIGGVPIDIDHFALLQYATFNYFLDERTFLKNIFRFKPGTMMSWDKRNLIQENYWNVAPLLSGDIIPEKDFLRKFSEMMHQIISQWIDGKKKVGIFLSGGYDSRAILACLHNLGVKGYAYTWDNPAIEETDIAKMLAETTGFKLRFLPFYPEQEDIERLVYEIEELTDFSFPIFHIGRYNAVKQIPDGLDIIFSGQGELIRITPVPNDYISPATLSYIYGRKDDKAQHFFNIETPDKIFDDFSYRHLQPAEQLTCFLLYNAYRGDYGILRYGESRIIPVVMPFFDGRIIELLLKSPFSIARLNSWKRNLPFTFKTRKIYYDIVKQMAPHLLDIPLDRGYLQKFDNSYLNIVLTGFGNLKNAIGFKEKRGKIPPWWRFVYNLLSQDKTLNRDFYNSQKLKESLKKFPSWTPEESYELEKVARFELFYRHFFQSN